MNPRAPRVLSTSFPACESLSPFPCTPSVPRSRGPASFHLVSSKFRYDWQCYISWWCITVIRHLYTLRNGHRGKSIYRLSPPKVNTILLTVFPMLCIKTPWLIYLNTVRLYFFIASLKNHCQPSPSWGKHAGWGVCLPGSNLPTHQVQGQGQQQQEQPQVEVAAVGELALLRVVVPAAGERGPHALPEQLQRLGHHACCAPGPAAPRALRPPGPGRPRP